MGKSRSIQKQLAPVKTLVANKSGNVEPTLNLYSHAAHRLLIVAGEHLEPRGRMLIRVFSDWMRTGFMDPDQSVYARRDGRDGRMGDTNEPVRFTCDSRFLQIIVQRVHGRWGPFVRTNQPRILPPMKYASALIVDWIGDRFPDVLEPLPHETTDYLLGKRRAMQEIQDD